MILHPREGLPSLARLVVFGVRVGPAAHPAGGDAGIPSVGLPSALSPALSANCQSDQWFGNLRDPHHALSRRFCRWIRKRKVLFVLASDARRTHPTKHMGVRSAVLERGQHQWRDLAPQILRQRLVVEGTCDRPIGDLDIREYLNQLATVCEMVTLTQPVTHRSERYGWAGWVHWETSGAHFYAWEQPVLFFSIDIYTCKAFDPDRVIDFTARYFDANDIVGRAF